MSKSPSLRRIQADIRELALDPSDRYFAAPLEHDMFEWHFTIRGADGTDFEGGVYHGRILLPPEYPLKPPHIMFLTPSGRFEINTKICLSFSAYHPELWQPAWGIRLILEALISFLPTPADGAIGALDWSSAERKRLAKLSREYRCPTCCCGKQQGSAAINTCLDLLPKIGSHSSSSTATPTAAASKKGINFAKEIAELQRLQQINEGVASKTTTNLTPTPTNNVSTVDNSSNSGNNNGHDVVDNSVQTKTNNNININSSNEDKRDPCLKNNTSLCKEIVQKEPSKEDSQKEDSMDTEPSSSSKDGLAQDVITDAPPQSQKRSVTTNNEIRVASPTTTTPGETHEMVMEGNGSSRSSNPQVTVHEEETANGEHANDDDEDENDLSWMYDPLLNLMMVLMAVICFLLIQKYQELVQELHELSEWTSSSAAGAATGASNAEL